MHKSRYINKRAKYLFDFRLLWGNFVYISQKERKKQNNSSWFSLSYKFLCIGFGLRAIQQHSILVFIRDFVFGFFNSK